MRWIWLAAKLVQRMPPARQIKPSFALLLAFFLESSCIRLVTCISNVWLPVLYASFHVKAVAACLAASYIKWQATCQFSLLLGTRPSSLILVTMTALFSGYACKYSCSISHTVSPETSQRLRHIAVSLLSNCSSLPTLA